MTNKFFLPKYILHIEGAILLAAGIYAYAQFDGNWLLFALLFLTPDISIAGYLAGAHIGAITYNTAHAYTLPAMLGAYGLLTPNAFAISLALIWFTHLGFDRLLGFGLKYPDRFKDTHLDRV